MTTWSEWIDWNSGSCPIDKKEIVKIMLRDGTILDCGSPAGAYDWFHADDGEDDLYDIIAYCYKETDESED